MFKLTDRKNIVIATAFILAMTIVTLGIIFHEIPFRDVASRYAPMAEAFANGDWQYAFHPRIQMLQPLSGGIIAFLFGCSGFAAQKTASMLWFIGGALICWKLFRLLYEDRPWIATAAAVFYLLFPYSIHMAYSGLRESAKCTILLWSVWALVRICRNTKQISGYILLGIGCFLAVLCRADMILVGTAVLFYGTVLECREKKYPLLAMIPMAMTSAGYLLSSLINWRLSGHAMPDYRLSAVFSKVSGHPAQCSDVLLGTAAVMILIAAAAVLTAKLIRRIPVRYFILAVLVLTILVSVVSGINDRTHTVGEFLMSIFKGNYHVVGIISLFAVFYRLYQKKLTSGESLLYLVFLTNLFLNILPMQIFHKVLYVSDRYLYPAVPLLAGFFVIGIYEIYLLLQKKLPLKLCKAAVILAYSTFCIIFLVHAFQPLQRQLTRKKDIQTRNGILELARAIRDNYDGEKNRKEPFSLSCYHSPKAPAVVFYDKNHKITVAAYLAGGQATTLLDRADFFVGNKCPAKLRKKVKLTSTIKFGKKSLKLWRIIQ